MPNQAKHTSGPWKLGGHMTNHEQQVFAPGDCPFAILHHGHVRGDEMQANANLVVAAPDLLTELKEAHRIISAMLNMMTDEQRAELSKLDVGHGAVRYHVRNDAICKAEGRINL